VDGNGTIIHTTNGGGTFPPVVDYGATVGVKPVGGNTVIAWTHCVSCHVSVLDQHGNTPASAFWSTAASWVVRISSGRGVTHRGSFSDIPPQHATPRQGCLAVTCLVGAEAKARGWRMPERKEDTALKTGTPRAGSVSDPTAPPDARIGRVRVLYWVH
jgi:hypothetical protein